VTDAVYEAGLGRRAGRMRERAGMTPGGLRGGKARRSVYNGADAVWMDGGGGDGARVVLAGAGSTSAERKGPCARSFRWRRCGGCVAVNAGGWALESVRDGSIWAGSGGPAVRMECRLDLRGRCFSCGCGRRCGRFREARRGVTASWRGDGRA